MFHTATNEKIGNHLADLIKQSNYNSDRQFGIAYFKQRYNFDPSSEEIQKIQNRICQIKKAIRAYKSKIFLFFRNFFRYLLRIF